MPSLLDTALIAAIVSAAVTALGWYAGHWSERRLESQRRIERIVDAQTALLAEIESNLTRYEEIDLDGHMLDMTRRILRSTRYQELEQDRKARIYEDYVWQIKTVLVTGEQARGALRNSLGLPLNSQEAGRSLAFENL
jgi:hypothetical protein